MLLIKGESGNAPCFRQTVWMYDYVWIIRPKNKFAFIPQLAENLHLWPVWYVLAMSKLYFRNGTILVVIHISYIWHDHAENLLVLWQQFIDLWIITLQLRITEDYKVFSRYHVMKQRIDTTTRTEIQMHTEAGPHNFPPINLICGNQKRTRVLNYGFPFLW